MVIIMMTVMIQIPYFCDNFDSLQFNHTNNMIMIMMTIVMTATMTLNTLTIFIINNSIVNTIMNTLVEIIKNIFLLPKLLIGISHNRTIIG